MPVPEHIKATMPSDMRQHVEWLETLPTPAETADAELALLVLTNQVAAKLAASIHETIQERGLPPTGQSVRRILSECG
jgi:hypothetical protein